MIAATTTPLRIALRTPPCCPLAPSCPSCRRQCCHHPSLHHQHSRNLRCVVIAIVIILDTSRLALLRPAILGHCRLNSPTGMAETQVGLPTQLGQSAGPHLPLPNLSDPAAQAPWPSSALLSSSSSAPSSLQASSFSSSPLFVLLLRWPRPPVRASSAGKLGRPGHLGKKQG